MQSNRSIWKQEQLSTKGLPVNAHIGCIYSTDLYNMLQEIHMAVYQNGHQLVIPAFEDPTFSFTKFLSSICQEINGSADMNDSDDANFNKIIDPVYDVAHLAKYYEKHEGVSNIDGNFRNLWDTFIRENCLNPVSILITGPPKSKKTDIAKVVAEK